MYEGKNAEKDYMVLSTLLGALPTIQTDNFVVCNRSWLRRNLETLANKSLKIKDFAKKLFVLQTWPFNRYWEQQQFFINLSKNKLLKKY